jgi:hypothetical protein
VATDFEVILTFYGIAGDFLSEFKVCINGRRHCYMDEEVARLWQKYIWKLELYPDVGKALSYMVGLLQPLYLSEVCGTVYQCR